MEVEFTSDFEIEEISSNSRYFTILSSAPTETAVLLHRSKLKDMTVGEVERVGEKMSAS